MWALSKNQNGFTIVELLIVIVVIAILAAIAITAYTGVQSKTYDSAVQSDIRSFGSKIMHFNTTEGKYPTTASELNKIATPASINSYAKNANALHYCVGSNGFAIGGSSKSGNNGYYLSNISDGLKRTAWWPATDGKALCASFGITVNTGDTVGYFSANNTNGWNIYIQP
jgi:prepilin-type N-terminal cleavage/methylation domain-containing protein